MNSSTSRNNERKQTQEELKRQIALLQARLEPEPATIPRPALSPKRKKAPTVVTLAPATPSPKKKRKLDHHALGKPPPRLVFQTGAKQNSTSHISGQGIPITEQFKKPEPSTMLSKLASMSRKIELVDSEAVRRSGGFTEQPQEIQKLEDGGGLSSSKRDDRLALVQSLEPGPYEHNPPIDDPDFEKLEPHSGITLLSRTIPHVDFADYLRGRFYLSPSRLYSAIQLLPDKQGYDVPVPGDWVTVAVIAERGPIKFTRAPVAVEREEGDEDPKKKKQWKGKSKDTPGGEKPSTGKKYINLKLIDFGARSGSSSSATGGKSVIRGDAFLTLLLFEADTFDLVPREGRKPEKVYRGGSRGAFEHLTNVKEGDVVALLNPKILKPFQRSGDTPHPVDNVLALTPESASSIMVIGRARDLGMCAVRKQDGKVCGSWCDKRVSDVCDYHVQNAVQRRRAARPEFSIGTSGLSTSSTHKRKNDYDPQRQWGLKPEESTGPGAGATYVVSGHVVSGTSSDPRTMYVTENIGREGQARAKRKMGGKDADKTLKALLQRDKEGMRAVMKAREVGAELRKEKEADGGRSGKGRAEKEKTKKRKQEPDDNDNEDSEEGEEERRNVMKSAPAYSAGVIKSLGFDPSMKPGQRRTETRDIQEKLRELEVVRTGRKDIILAPRPGPRIRSGVAAPINVGQLTIPGPLKDDVSLESDDDLPESVSRQHEVKMVDLDGS